MNPTETIPIACISTCCIVAMVFFLVDIAVIGSLEWDPSTDPPGYVVIFIYMLVSLFGKIEFAMRRV